MNTPKIMSINSIIIYMFIKKLGIIKRIIISTIHLLVVERFYLL